MNLYQEVVKNMRFKNQENLNNNLVSYISKVRKSMDDSPCKIPKWIYVKFFSFNAFSVEGFCQTIHTCCLWSLCFSLLLSLVAQMVCNNRF
jgi:hypothetical protein